MEILTAYHQVMQTHIRKGTVSQMNRRVKEENLQRERQMALAER